MTTVELDDQELDLVRLAVNHDLRAARTSIKGTDLLSRIEALHVKIVRECDRREAEAARREEGTPLWARAER